MDNHDLNLAYDFIQKIKLDIKTKNRFHVDIRFDTLIDLYSKEQLNWQVLHKNSSLYRARVYNEKNAKSRYENPPKSRFKGYNKEGSFVNLKNESINDGRCNPRYIPYLYASSSKECCLHEIRVTENSYASIANIKVKEDLRLLCLKTNKAIYAKTGYNVVDGIKDIYLFLHLATEFRSLYKEYGDYLLCQYVSEKIKASPLGFDGIAYQSAVYNGKSNTNYVIFNFEKCIPTSSKLYKIKNIEIDYI